MINIVMTTGNSPWFIVTFWLLTPPCYVLQLQHHDWYLQYFIFI